MSKHITKEMVISFKQEKDQNNDISDIIHGILEIYSDSYTHAYFNVQDWNIESDDMIHCQGHWEYCDGDLSLGTHHVFFPLDLLNKEDYEIEEWFETVKKEYEMREAIRKKEKILRKFEHDRDLLQFSIRNLTDPLWIEERIHILEKMMEEKDQQMEEKEKEIKQLFHSRNTFFDFLPESLDDEITLPTYDNLHMLTEEKRHFMLSRGNDEIDMQKKEN